MYGFLSLCNGRSYDEGYAQNKKDINESSSIVDKLFFTNLLEKAMKVHLIKGNIKIEGINAYPNNSFVFGEVLSI